MSSHKFVQVTLRFLVPVDRVFTNPPIQACVRDAESAARDAIADAFGVVNVVKVETIESSGEYVGGAWTVYDTVSEMYLTDGREIGKFDWSPHGHAAALFVTKKRAEEIASRYSDCVVVKPRPTL